MNRTPMHGEPSPGLQIGAGSLRIGFAPCQRLTLPRPAQGLIGLCRRAGHARPEVGARALVRCPAALARARASLFATRSLTRAGRRQLAARGAILGPPAPEAPPPPAPSRTDWTSLVPPPVLTGHVSSLVPY